MDQQNPSTRSLSADRSPAMMTVDNLLRRALRVDDPRDPEKVAKALLTRYSDEAEQIRREQRGLPFSVAQAGAAYASPVNGTATRPEIGAALAALDDALRELTTSPALSNIAPELRGWAMTIRRAASDGLGSARFAIDPTERDRAFGARRTLGEYGLLARYAGAVSDCARDVYCRVARACDGVANLVIITLGDGLADVGIARSGGMLQAPAATLQMRRDNVIAALRNLLGANQGDAQESWPRGPVAVFRLYKEFDAAGAPDLRALLDETYLARQLDALIDLAAGSTPDGLRALGSVSATSVATLQRFISVGMRLEAASPPAVSFFAELNLFVQGFVNNGAGYRLPYLARSPLLISSFNGSGGTDDRTADLLQLAYGRTILAESVDCLSCDSGSVNETRAFLVAAKALFSIDRAIDLYALGTTRNGFDAAEWRAVAFGAVAVAAGGLLRGRGAPPTWGGAPLLDDAALTRRMVGVLDRIGRLLHRRLIRSATITQAAQLAEVFNLQLVEELRWSTLIQSIAPLCRQDLLFNPVNFTGAPRDAGPPGPTGDPISVLLQGATWATFLVLPQDSQAAFQVTRPQGQLAGQDIPPTGNMIAFAAVNGGALL